MTRILRPNSLRFISSALSNPVFTSNHTAIPFSSIRRNITMATAQKIHIDTANTGLWKVKQTDESAKKTSELLQQDLEARHLFFSFHSSTYLCVRAWE